MHDPQFKKLFTDLRRSDIQGVAVAEQSRLFRPGEFEDFSILGHFKRNNKFIFTPNEKIDTRASGGRMSAILNGLMSGEELIKIRERCDGGKAIMRARGGNPNGKQLLPRGVRYVKTRDADGKLIKVINSKGYSVTGRWEHVPLEVERIKKAYALLLENMSFEQIAVEIGGKWTGKGIRDALTNPIWIGIRE